MIRSILPDGGSVMLCKLVARLLLGVLVSAVAVAAAEDKADTQRDPDADGRRV